MDCAQGGTHQIKLSRRWTEQVKAAPLPTGIRVCLFLLAIGVCARTGFAQELTPRAYWPAPRGTRVAVVGYSYATGDVFFDPSIPLYGVDSRIHSGVFAYVQTFSLLRRSANILVDLPCSWGTTRGFIGETSAQGDFSGVGDLGVTLAVNLKGAPSMSRKEFQELRGSPRPILGASLRLVAPTGRYNSNRLLNVSANRWATRVELGYMIPLKPKWLLEIDGGAWFFSDDRDFLTGTREQEPILNAQAHLVKRFQPGFWASVDFNFFAGGRQTIARNQLDDVQRNSRLGGTIAVPVQGRHAVKFGYSQGVSTEFGTDFHQFLVSYQVLLN